MTIVDLLSHLREVGVQLTLDGDKLKIKAPQGALTDELKDQLKQNKEAIIAFLQGATQEVKSEVFPVIDRNGKLPLSYNQQGLWFFEQLTPGTAAYTMPIAFKLYGPVNIDGLRDAVAQVMQRQESLRSRFSADEQGISFVVIDDEPAVPFEASELVVEDNNADVVVRELVSRQAMSTFDLERGPLFRLQCVTLKNSSGETLFTLLTGAMHHIISDGWSMNVFVKEIFVAYLQKVTALPIPIPPLTVQYVDFAAWQQDYLRSDTFAKRLDYWLRHLQGIPSHLALPTDFPRPFVQGNNGGKYEFTLDKALSDSFGEFCKQHDVTLFMGLMAAWKFVMFKYAGQEDFCLGIPMAGRNHKGLENIIGLFIDPLIVRSPISAHKSLLDNLFAVRKEILDAFEHQEVPLAQIVDKLQVPRNPAYAPIVQIGFQLQNFAGVIADAEVDKALYGKIEELSQLRVERVKIEDVASKFDMIVSLSQSDANLSGYIEFNADIFTQSTIAKLIGHFSQTIAALMQHPEVALNELNLVTFEELRLALGIPNAVAIRTLTDTQMLLYMDAAMSPDTVQNSIGTLIDLPFAVDIEKLQASLAHIISTYSIYRTRFVSCDIPWAEKVYQVVLPEVALPLTIEDASELDEQTLKARAQAWVYTAYDIHSDAIYAFKLYRRDDNNWRLALKFHHIVIDGTSLVYLTDKLGQCYDALTAGNPLPQWEDRFEEFIDIRRREVDRFETLEYWRGRFRDCVPLSISRIPGATRSADFEVLNYEIDSEHSKKIQQFCKKNRTHPVEYFRLLTAIMIRHYCRPEGNFVFNEVQNGRANAKDDTLGVFYQAVPYVIDTQFLSSTTSLRQCYDAFSAYRKEIRNYRQYSVLAQLHATEASSIFFQFNYFNFLAEHIWQGQTLFTELQSAHVDRTVQCFFKELPDTWLMQLWCDRTTFDDHRYLERVAWLSKQIVDGGAQTLGDLQFVLPDELPQIAQINKVVEALPAFGSIIDSFEQSVLQHATKEAVRHGDRALNYQDLNAKANRLARALHDQGVGRGDRVAILLSRRVEMLVAVLGVLKAGAAYVPVEASYPCDRIQYIIRDSGAKAVITEDCQLSKIGETSAWLFDVDADAPQLSLYSSENLSAKPGADDEIYVIYTSGSTGQPKGASVHHRGELNLQQWYINTLQLGADDSTLIISAFGFDLTQKNLYALLLVGGTLVLPEMEDYDDGIVRDAIFRHAITLINCAPSAFYPLVATPDQYSQVNTLRWVVLGGEPIRLPLLFPWLASENCIARLVNSYGPTECTDVVSFHVLESLESDQTLIPIGLPVPNCELHILDHALIPVAPGLIGELCVTGICVGNGYVGRPDLTEAAFVNNPFGSGKLYKTGDLCRQLPGGEIEYIGRKDFQVKVRGLRIELGEIEKALTESGTVSDGMVLVKDEKLVAYIVAPDSIDLGALRSHLRARLPEYMVPGFIVRLDAWPLTPNGKVDRKALPLPGQAAGGSNYVAPRNDIERRLVQIWEEVLKLDQIGVQDNFFELGGHSLLATQIVSRTRKSFDVALSLRDLLTEPTISALAEKIQVGSAAGNAPAIVHADRNARIPLSFAQQRLWLLDRIEPGNIAYNVPVALRVKGGLQVSALQQAVSDVINRHEGLRTVFREDEEGAYQYILPVQRWQTEEISLSDSTDDVVFELQRAVGQQIAYSFDLAAGPLFQSKLISVGEQQWVYVFVAHHIVTDGWSMGLFIREVLMAYLAYTRGLPQSLPPVALQYADFAVWQRKTLDEVALQQKLQFWTQALEEVPVLALPTDFPRPAVQTFKGASVRFALDAEVSERIDALARMESTTPFSVLMSLFSALLSRYSNQADFAIGTPVAGRDNAELENIIGFFVNTVAIRVRPLGSLSLRGLLRQISDSASSAFEHQEIPFEQIVDAVDPARDMSRSPLFQVMMVLQNIPLDTSAIEQASSLVRDISLEAVAAPVETAKFDLTLTFAMGNGRYEASLQYNTDLFASESIERMVGHLQRISHLWLNDPEQSFKSLDLLTDTEKQSLIAQRNLTARTFDKTLTLQRWFAVTAKTCATNTAIQCGETKLTYQALDEASDKIAHRLLSEGVKPGDRVGVCYDRSLHLMSALLGVLKAGATYVPIDASYPQGRISYMVQKAEICHVVTRPHLRASLPADACIHDADEILAGTPDIDRSKLQSGKPDDLLYVIFTSGSTGNPKGASVYQRSEVNLLKWYTTEFSMTPTDRVLLMSAIGFDLTQKNIWAPLMQGACLVIPDFQEYDAAAFAALVETQRITWINCAPSAFYPLVDSDIAKPDYPDLRWAFLGGEPINFSRLANWYRNTRAAIVNSYGPTECTDISAYHVTAHDHPVHARVPIGRPNYNVQVYVLGSDLELLPPGATGELYVGGEGVGAGYINDSELTDKSFVPHVLAQGEGINAGKLYKTGDLVRYLPSGEIDYLGRIDHQIKLRGYRIEIEEIQAVINSVEGVIESHVAVQGTGASQMLAAWIVRKGDFDDNALRAAIEEKVNLHLPVFMRPQACVLMDAFPLTPNGKIDRKALPAAETSDDEAFVAPATTQQKEVAQIWCQALSLERVGLNSNFFSIGGNSLLATQIIAKINKKYNAQISVRSLFDNPRFEEFCRHIETAERGARLPAMISHPVVGDHPLSYGQSRLWYFEQLNPGTCVNNIPGALLIKGDFDVAGVRFAVNELFGRHAVLRATFYLDGENGPKQHINARVVPDFIELNVADILQADAITEYIDAQLAIQTTTPFDLTTGPLLRVQIHKLPAIKREGDTSVAQYALIFCMHHIASDGLSMNVLLRELMTHYASYASRKPMLLPSLKLQYTDYARWQREWLESSDVEEELQYWEQQLRGAADFNTFPTDFARPAVQTTRGEVLQFAMESALVEKIESLAKAQNITPFVLTLAAWKMLLCRYNQREDIAVGVPTAGRAHPDLEPLIGFFVNSIIIRSRWAHNATLMDVVNAVKNSTLGAFSHSHVPLDMIMERLPIKRSMSHTPMVQVAFQLFSESENADMNALSEFAKLDVEMFNAKRGTSNFDATLNLQHTPGNLKAALEYNIDLFQRETMQTLWQQYVNLLQALVETPELPLQALQLDNSESLLKQLGLSAAEYSHVIPLTHMQRDMFVDNMVNPASLQSSHGFVIHLSKPLNLDIWKQAVAQYFAFYPVARARYVSTDNPALDVGYLAVPHEAKICVEFDDQNGNLHGREAVETYLENFIYHPYDLSRDELVKFKIVKAAENHYVVSASAHHAIFDGIALTTMWQQLANCYNAILARQSFSFTDDIYLEHVAEDRETKDTAAVLDFWKRTLASVEPLDFTVPPPVPAASKARLLEHFVSDEHWVQIRSYCRKQKITPAIYFKGLYALMINVYCRPDSDFSLQETMSGRTQSHAMQPGCYIQEVPFVVPKSILEAGRLLDGLWEHSREYQKNIKDQRLISLGAQARLSPRGRIGFMYNFYQFVPQTLELAGDVIEDPEGTPSDPASNVQFVVSFVGGKLRLSLFYHPHLFDDRNMLARIESISRQIIDQGVECIGDLRWVTQQDETQLLLEQWNDTRTAFDLSVPMHQRFQQQALANPAALAIVDDRRQLSYAELDRYSNQLAQYLIGMGAGEGDLIGLCVERSCEFLIGILGILKCGAAYVPMDAHYPQERITYMRENSQAKLIVSQFALRVKLGVADTFKPVFIDTDWHHIEKQSDATPDVSVAPTSIAYMLYTSGSTGLPKGALIRHDGALNHIEAERKVLEFSGAFNFLQTAPASSDISVWQFLGPVTCGGTVVVLDEVTQADKMFALVNKFSVNVVELVPVAWQLLIEHIKSLPENDRNMPSLRWLMATGEAVPVPMVNEWLAMFPDIPVVNAYGPTEAADDVIQNTITQPLPADVRSVPIGKPLANMNVFIVDEHMRLVPPGIPGEICLSGIGVGNGYWQNPEKTESAFVANPFEGTQGPTIYKTGDLGRWLVDGTVEYLDRVDNQVKIRGFRIELGEVEAVLAAQAQVAESAVIVRKDMPGGPALVGYVVPHEGAEAPDLSVLRAGMRERLPEYMVPSAIVILQAFPTTPAGKVDKKNLPAPTEQTDNHYVAPRTQLETDLAAAYASVLGREQISIDREFFDLGGNSLMAVRLVSRLAQSLQRTISVAQLLRTSSVQALAQWLEIADTEQISGPLVELQRAPENANPLETTAVLFVHPVGGDVLCYNDLRQHWGSSVPMLGLRSPGLDDDSEPVTALPSLLQLYAQAVSATPWRRWTLVGQSLGGTLAMALADELRAQGHHVQSLVMIDSFHPEVMKTRSDRLLVDALGLQLPKALLPEISVESAPDNVEGSTDSWIDNVYNYAAALKLVPVDLTLARIKRIYRVARANEHLAQQTQLPATAPYPVLHIAAKDNTERAPAGWQERGMQFSFEEHTGNHETVMRGENAKGLIDIIRRFLQTIQ